MSGLKHFLVDTFTAISVVVGPKLLFICVNLLITYVICGVHVLQLELVFVSLDNTLDFLFCFLLLLALLGKVLPAIL